MSFRASIRLCRTLVIVLLFNAVAPVVMAAEGSENGQVLLCTTAGLIQVSLTEFEGNNDSKTENTAALGEHCPYCKLAGLPIHTQNKLPPYLIPDTTVILHYQSVLPTRAAQHIVDSVLLRAPPAKPLL